MWTCPKCKRQFKNANQWHGCHQLPLDDLLEKRKGHIADLYSYLHQQFDFANYRREFVPPDVIFYKTKSTFLAIKLKTKWIDVDFFLDYYMDSPIVKKWLQTSKRRWVYVVSIDNETDVSDELMEWIRYSYALISG